MAGKAAFGHIACRNGLLFPYFLSYKKTGKKSIPSRFLRLRDNRQKIL
jgi:hypothetical protein